MDSNGYNGSVFPTGRCYICGRYGDLVRHEVFHGPNRKKSKELGCWVELCPSCHMDLHENPADYRWLQRECQEKAMVWHRWGVKEFRDVFGKSYL